MKTLTEMLHKRAHHYESMDEGVVIYVEEAKQVFKEWLKEVALTPSTAEKAKDLLITLVDEP